MTNRAAAARYARALFDVVVKENGDLQLNEDQLTGFVELLRQHPPLEQALLNPAVPAPRKRSVVSDLTARLGVATVLAKLLALLAERDRLALLPDVLAAYHTRLLDHRRIVRAEVTTATPLSDDRARAIERVLARITGKSVSVVTRVEPGILGGVIARIGGTVYDASLSRQLERMRGRLVETV
jgi:F-type H+-transporting ATPase subunit delta